MIARIRVAALIVLCFFLASLTIVAQEGRIVRETVYSPSLEGNLFDDSPNRQVTIYLPPSYDTEPERLYPVVYLLHGYTGNHYLWTGGSYVRGANIINAMESWLKSGTVEEMILVMPNSYTKFQGGYYINSPAIGKWGDFISKDLVQYIDSNYRTLPQSESRAVMGHSMGADSTIRIGILRSDVFSCIGCLAASFDLEEWMNDNKTSYALASTIKDWAQFYSSSLLVKASFADAAAFAPNPDSPPFYCDLPFVYTDTKPRKIVKNQEAYNRFLEFDPLRMAAASTKALQSMSAIYIDCGLNDGFGTLKHARVFHEKLNSLGIKHVYREFAGDHTCCVMTSTGNALGVFSDAMEYTAVSGVEPAGRLATTWGRIRVAWR